MNQHLKLRGGTVALVVLAVIALFAVYAKLLGVFPGSAASLGQIDAAPLGGGTSPVSACSKDAVVLDQFKTAFVAAERKYELRSVRFAEVPSRCVGLNFALAGPNRDGLKGTSAAISGKVPEAGKVVNFEEGAGPDLSKVKVASNRIQLALVVYG